MTNIRPATVPQFHFLSRAWVVNDEMVAYLERGDANIRDHFILTCVTLEHGIGGRLIEPTFANQDDFLDRSTLLTSLTYNTNHPIILPMDEDLLIRRIQEEWEVRLALRS